MTYDFAGRKTQMADPEMDSWSYAYDGLGNLTRQADARGQRICLYYDADNRLISKHYRIDDNFPSSPTYDASYTFDSYDPNNGQYGKGLRTGMADGSGSTSWIYDTRGRVIKEIKTVIDNGWFVTQWAYNSADLVTSLKYPGNNSGGMGEELRYTYHRQMTVASVCAWNGSSCATNYASGVHYDAAGRMDLLKLGGTEASPTLLLDDTYYILVNPILLIFIFEVK